MISILRITPALILLFVFHYPLYPGNALGDSAQAQKVGIAYPVVDTGQDRCFTNTREIPYPDKGHGFYGQDAQYAGNALSYKDNSDGTVSDLTTGLMWQKSPDLENKSTLAQALAGEKRFDLAGYHDWRLPTIKELYSLIVFRGYSMRTVKQSKPYLDTRFFDFAYGDESKGQRLIDAQYWSRTEYAGTTMRNEPTAFGVNFADGRIKGYPKANRGHHGQSGRFVRYVRGNPKYGLNDFVDKGDGTVLDRATGLMWMKKDGQKFMNWQQALAYAENLTYAGYDDWRLPNAKELQSIVDYTRAPDASSSSLRSAAIDPIFEISEQESYYWTSTTHLEGRTCGFAVYICFGRAMGQMHGRRMNVHGAGAQRSDPKAGNPDDWKSGNGPQGDDVRIKNAVRCVRGGNVRKKISGPPVSGQFSAGRRSLERDQIDRFRPKPSGSARPVKGFVTRLDRDGDGRVSRQEFDGPPFHFDALDRNRDSYLSENERPN